MTRRRPWYCGLVLALVLTLAACAGAPQPFHYQPANDLKPGPGLFTGKEGMWTVVGSSQSAKPQTPKDAQTGIVEGEDVEKSTGPAKTHDE